MGPPENFHHNITWNFMLASIELSRLPLHVTVKNMLYCLKQAVHNNSKDMNADVYERSA